jgi:hypothetical protein
MMDIRYFLVLVGWVLLLVGFWSKKYPIAAFAGMMLMVIGVHIVIYGLPEIQDTFLLTSLALVQITVGGYVFVRGTWEQYKNY